MLGSLALLLEHGLGQHELARALDDAVAYARSSTPTPDLGGGATTGQFGEAVLEALLPVTSVP
jgi:isocitrate/isopropylmalate dehydrogenase